MPNEFKVKNGLITPAGSATQAGGFKLTSGTLKTTPVAADSGRVEYDGTSMYIINGSGARKTFAYTDSVLTSATLTIGTGLTGTSYNGTQAVTIAVDTSTIPTLSGTNTLTNKSLVDANTFIVDNSDSTKRVQFEVSGLSTSTTRTLTVPDASGTIALTSNIPTVNNATLTLNVSGNGLSGSQTFTSNQSTAATFTVTSNATSANTVSTLVFRDGSGNFSAGTITASLSGNATTATTLQTARTINGTSFNGSANIETTEWIHSDRDFPAGTLVTTSINYSVSGGDPWILEIKGNAYGSLVPFDIQYQGYIYSDTIINHGGYSNGTNITGLVVLNVGGNLCFWWPNQSYWHGYNVRVYTAYSTRAVNKVVSITNTAKPSGTKEVALTANIRQSLHSGNYTSYAPSLTGTGASGTWGISVTGNAATATKLQTARNINGVAFDGSQDITISVSPGNFSSQSANTFMAAPNGSAGVPTFRTIVAADIPTLNQNTTGSAGSVLGLTLNSSASPINPTNVTQNQIGYATSVSLFSQTDGGLYSSAYDSTWIHQIFGDFRTGQIAVRGKNSGTWQAWRTVLDSTNYSSYSPTLTGTGASGTWSISVTGNAATATTLQTARNINEVSFNGSANITIPRVSAVDDRVAAPADFTTSYATVGFGSWNNNNTSPYADYIAFRTYTDASGGSDNMVSFRKDAIGMRVWQQTYGSATAFATYKDVAFTDSNITGSAATLTTTRTIWGQNFNGSANVTGNLTSVGNITGTGAVTLTATSGTLALAATGANIITTSTNGTERTRIISTGEMGIGVTPDTGINLDVGGADSANIRARATTNGVDIRMNASGSATNTGFLGTVSNHPLAIVTNNQERVRVTTAGNVGIGTSSPAYPLDVVTSSRVTGAFLVTGLSTPSAPTGTGSTTGGTLAAATYFAKIIAIDAVGNASVISAESTGVTTTGSTSSIVWSWTAVTGAVKYLIYYGTTSGTSYATYFETSTNSYTLRSTSGVGTGSISGTTLTITAMTSGSFAIGTVITSSGGTVSHGVITAFGTGSGSTGTYTLSQSSTLSSTTITGGPFVAFFGQPSANTPGTSGSISADGIVKGGNLQAIGVNPVGGVGALLWNGSNNANAVSQLLFGNDASIIAAGIYQYSTTSTTANEMRMSNGQNAPITFYTNGSEKLRIEAGGNILSRSGAIGYGTGAGSTVTQGSTSGKGTAVTINSPSGRITMNNATLNANTTAAFIFSNTFIGANDVVVVSVQTGVTAHQNYLVWAAAYSAGACGIYVRNISAGNLSEALVLNYVVIKGGSA